MVKKLLVLMLILGMLFGVSVGIASAAAEEDPPGGRNGDEPPPTREPCDLTVVEQRVAAKLAKIFDVEPVEIEDWYCLGYDFGEIALAYKISMVTDYTVEEIFAMREDGLTWVEIIKEVGLIGVLPSWWDQHDDKDGVFPVGKICLGDEANPIIESLAEMFGLTYDEAYRWVCGPFDYTNVGWDDGDWMGDVDDFEYKDWTVMHITATDWIPDDFDWGNLPPMPNPGDFDIPDWLKKFVPPELPPVFPGWMP